MPASKKASKATVKKSSTIDVDSAGNAFTKEVNDWAADYQADDPVWSTAATRDAWCTMLGITADQLQPWQHTHPDYLPNQASKHNLARLVDIKWSESPIKLSKGPGCFLPGKATEDEDEQGENEEVANIKAVCHSKGFFPAFGYTLPGFECDEAKKRNRPTILFRWANGKLLACWACYDFQITGCKAGGKSLPLTPIAKGPDAAGSSKKSGSNVRSAGRKTNQNGSPEEEETEGPGPNDQGGAHVDDPFIATPQRSAVDPKTPMPHSSFGRSQLGGQGSGGVTPAHNDSPLKSKGKPSDSTPLIDPTTQSRRESPVPPAWSPAGPPSAPLPAVSAVSNPVSGPQSTIPINQSAMSDLPPESSSSGLKRSIKAVESVQTAEHPSKRLPSSTEWLESAEARKLGFYQSPPKALAPFDPSIFLPQPKQLELPGPAASSSTNNAQSAPAHTTIPPPVDMPFFGPNLPSNNLLDKLLSVNKSLPFTGGDETHGQIIDRILKMLSRKLNENWTSQKQFEVDYRDLGLEARRLLSHGEALESIIRDKNSQLRDTENLANTSRIRAESAESSLAAERLRFEAEVSSIRAKSQADNAGLVLEIESLRSQVKTAQDRQLSNVKDRADAEEWAKLSEIESARLTGEMEIATEVVRSAVAEKDRISANYDQAVSFLHQERYFCLEWAALWGEVMGTEMDTLHELTVFGGELENRGLAETEVYQLWEKAKASREDRTSGILWEVPQYGTHSDKSIYPTRSEVTERIAKLLPPFHSADPLPEDYQGVAPRELESILGRHEVPRISIPKGPLLPGESQSDRDRKIRASDNLRRRFEKLARARDFGSEVVSFEKMLLAVKRESHVRRQRESVDGDEEVPAVEEGVDQSQQKGPVREEETVPSHPVDTSQPAQV